jgi:hypothetical protein
MYHQNRAILAIEKMLALSLLVVLMIEVIGAAGEDAGAAAKEDFASMAGSRISVLSKIKSISHEATKSKSFRGSMSDPSSTDSEIEEDAAPEAVADAGLPGFRGSDNGTFSSSSSSSPLHPVSSPSMTQASETETAADDASYFLGSRASFSCPMANQELDFDTYDSLALKDAPPPAFVDADDADGAEPYYLTSRTGKRFYIRPIYFEALPYRDSNTCTRVFGWLSTPVIEEGIAPSDIQQVPAVVLVHGGGGTAFKDWNNKWAKNDFASISIAHEGQTDARPKKGSNAFKNMYKFWATHLWAGPYRRGGAYSDAISPFGEQWMYHAVADTILANNLLRSLPEINSEQIGITGVSWGGVILSTAIGFDNRFAFAISGYGCGSLSDSLSHMGYQLQYRQGIKDQYDRVWDPLLRLKNVTMPSLWISWPQERHFPMPDLAITYNTIPESSTVVPVLIPHLGHSHGYIYNREENYEFAKSVLSEGAAWAKQIQEKIFILGSEGSPPPRAQDLAPESSLDPLPSSGSERGTGNTDPTEPVLGGGDTPPQFSDPEQSLDPLPYLHPEPSFGSEPEMGNNYPGEPGFGGGENSFPSLGPEPYLDPEPFSESDSPLDVEPEPGMGNTDPVEPGFGGGDPMQGIGQRAPKTLYHILVESTKDFKYASLISTIGSVRKVSNDRPWRENKEAVTLNLVKCDDSVTPKRCTWSASATLPKDTTSWYINLCTSTSKTLCISSLYHEKA